MDAQLVVGILTPIISLLFAVVFFAFWRTNPALPYVRDFAIGYVLLGIAFAQTSFFSGQSIVLSLTLCSGLGTLAMIPVTHAFFSRQKIQTPIRSLIFVWGAGAAAVTIAAFWFDDIAQMVAISCLTAATIYIRLTWSLIRKENQSGVDRFFPSILIITAISLIFQSMVIWSNDIVLPHNVFKDSTPWIAINMIVIIQCCAVSIAVAMIAVSDSINMMSELAMKDELSGLQRRERFEEIAIEGIDKAKRAGVPVSLVVCDLDHFKNINDTHGHLAGDDVIKAFGEIIRQTARSTDVIGRIGGEEFALLLWNADQKGANLVAQQLRSALSTCDLTASIGETSSTASFGIAQWNGLDTYRGLFALADKALYHAKHSGRDCVKIAPMEKAQVA